MQIILEVPFETIYQSYDMFISCLRSELIQYTKRLTSPTNQRKYKIYCNNKLKDLIKQEMDSSFVFNSQGDRIEKEDVFVGDEIKITEFWIGNLEFNLSDSKEIVVESEDLHEPPVRNSIILLEEAIVENGEITLKLDKKFSKGDVITFDGSNVYFTAVCVEDNTCVCDTTAESNLVLEAGLEFYKIASVLI